MLSRKTPQTNGNGKPSTNGHSPDPILTLSIEEVEAVRLLRKHPQFGSPVLIVTLGQLTVYAQREAPHTADSKPSGHLLAV